MKSIPILFLLLSIANGALAFVAGPAAPFSWFACGFCAAAALVAGFFELRSKA